MATLRNCAPKSIRRCGCCGIKHTEAGSYCADCHECVGACDYIGDIPIDDFIRLMEQLAIGEYLELEND